MRHKDGYALVLREHNAYHHARSLGSDPCGRVWASLFWARLSSRTFSRVRNTREYDYETGTLSGVFVTENSGIMR